MILQQIPNCIHVQPTGLLSLLKGGKERGIGEENVLDVGKDDSLGFLVEKVEEGGVKDLHYQESAKACEGRC